MSTRGPIISSPPVSTVPRQHVRHGWKLGDPLRWKEQGREARGLGSSDEVRADVRYGARWLRRSPAFAAGCSPLDCAWIGTNTAIFQPGQRGVLTLMPVRPSGFALAPFSI